MRSFVVVQTIEVFYFVCSDSRDRGVMRTDFRVRNCKERATHSYGV